MLDEEGMIEAQLPVGVSALCSLKLGNSKGIRSFVIAGGGPAYSGPQH